MRATVLGTGSALPDGERAQSGLLVRDGATRILVDCGSGVLERLARTETGVTGLDAVCLTHGHVDHVSDLLPLLKARWLADCADALPVVGPPGTTELVDGLLDVHDYLAGRVRVDARDIAGGAFTLVDLDVETYETAHSTSMRSFAYRFGDALTVSGDTPADPGLAAFAAGTTLVHDCSFPDGHASDGHATPRELGRVLAGRNYHGVSLTHRYPDAEAAGDALVAGVREHYDGDVTVAHEGETIRCGPTDTG
ncbi:ribonuclease BN (tRNA processing enzyme) [Halarchaeum rubridurum]|uniref:MBL fold metallo-hydrolase n=1 Tax=Halarchaeum rubridurum TaxID=489911 RepID=A0A830FSK4_9EURY|nr:MBL fold metallo-hydrolase [Halarchaeum rubridurum]MBP1953688.1 ribonuclease BN (tRNA processing enzyme) [Halarchaeum rubridurum]GGM53932.1 MBL fold metallo-hydrolase [Halarchaeum rubridurum]